MYIVNCVIYVLYMFEFNICIIYVKYMLYICEVKLYVIYMLRNVWLIYV